MTFRIALVCTLGLSLAACGKVAAEADAGLPDGDGHVADPADAHLDGDGAVTLEPDAQTTGIASVTVFNESGGREQGANVVFQHADGTVVQKLATDAHGRASAIVD